MLKRGLKMLVWNLGPQGPKCSLEVFNSQVNYSMAHSERNLSAMLEVRIWSLGQEKPLKKEIATHSRILAWRIPGTEEPGGPQSVGSQRVTQPSD